MGLDDVSAFQAALESRSAAERAEVLRDQAPAPAPAPARPRPQPQPQPSPSPGPGPGPIPSSGPIPNPNQVLRDGVRREAARLAARAAVRRAFDAS